MSPAHWDEEDSATFLQLAEIFVPAREEQTKTLLQLIPAEHDEEFLVVELASGEGKLAETIMQAFPRCHYIALDGSPAMREQIVQRLVRFQDRLEVRPFEIVEAGWRHELPKQIRCVVSSLCVHHLSDRGKRQLFHDLAPKLARGGALLLADIIKPASERIARLYAQQYDEIVKAQSLAQRGNLSGFERFQALRWNYFTYDVYDLESIDKPSLLSEQLDWLKEAGFTTVDCFWLQAGHAVYGGYM